MIGRNDQWARLPAAVLTVWVVEAVVLAAGSSVGPLPLAPSSTCGAHLGDAVMLVGAVAVAGGITARLVRKG